MGLQHGGHEPAREPAAGGPTYWLTRFVILRLLGLVYVVAFLILINQMLALFGSDGLEPVGPFLEGRAHGLGSVWTAFWEWPTIFWFEHSNGFLMAVAYAGLVLSVLMLAGFANAISVFGLWFIYLSFIHRAGLDRVRLGDHRARGPIGELVAARARRPLGRLGARWACWVSWRF